MCFVEWFQGCLEKDIGRGHRRLGALNEVQLKVFFCMGLTQENSIFHLSFDVVIIAVLGGQEGYKK